MRRLVLVLAVYALALVNVTSAGAATPARLVVAQGSAHLAGGKLGGWFVVANRGGIRSVPTVAKVRVRGGKPPFRVKVIWTARRATIPSLAPSHTYRVRISATPSDEFGTERAPIRACVEDSCRTIGRLTVKDKWQRGHPALGPPAGSTAPTDAAPAPAGLDNGVAPPPISTVPTAPIPHPVDEPFLVEAGAVSYYAFVPASYDPSNLTATPLLVWAHGCGGEAEGEAWVVDPDGEGPQDWLTLSLAGRESPGDECWVPSVDEAKVMAALADFETHFNVNRRRVILGGYSSGGDLAYRTGFRHSSTFAGLLIANSSPFRDTESSQAESLAAATTTKFHIVHLAHLQDTTYAIAGVRTETEAVKAAGFPIERIEVSGEHWNDAGDLVAGHAVPGTDADIRTYLLPHIDGWLAPMP
jgi:hypothetical protein